MFFKLGHSPSYSCTSSFHFNKSKSISPSFLNLFRPILYCTVNHRRMEVFKHPLSWNISQRGCLNNPLLWNISQRGCLNNPPFVKHSPKGSLNKPLLVKAPSFWWRWALNTTLFTSWLGIGHQSPKPPLPSHSFLITTNAFLRVRYRRTPASI